MGALSLEPQGRSPHGADDAGDDDHDYSRDERDEPQEPTEGYAVGVEFGEVELEEEYLVEAATLYERWVQV